MNQPVDRRKPRTRCRLCGAQNVRLEYRCSCGNDLTPGVDWSLVYVLGFVGMIALMIMFLGSLNVGHSGAGGGGVLPILLFFAVLVIAGVAAMANHLYRTSIRPKR